MEENTQSSPVDSSGTSPSTMSSSSSQQSMSTQSGLVSNHINMNSVSFEDYLSMTNDGGVSGDQEAEAPDTPMTGIEFLPSTPDTRDDSMLSIGQSSSNLKKKLFAARKTTPTFSPTPSKSNSGNEASSPSKDTFSAAVPHPKRFTIASTADTFISRYPELLAKISKSQIVDTIVNSNLISAGFDQHDFATYHGGYAQIDNLAEAILARVTHAVTSSSKGKEKEVTLDKTIPGAEAMNVDHEENAEIDVDDPIAYQEKLVLSLRTVLSASLDARFPDKKIFDYSDFAGDEEHAFREKLTTLKSGLYIENGFHHGDYGLHLSILEFEREEETLHLLKEHKVKAEADDRKRAQKETPEEVQRRNMAFLAGDMPAPSAMLFSKDYVDRYSNNEDIAKMKHMLKKDGPLMSNYRNKTKMTPMARLTEQMAQREVAKKAHAALLQECADMKASKEVANKSMEELTDFEGGEADNADNVQVYRG